MSIGWEFIGIVPLDFVKENNEPEIRQFIIEKWIRNIQEIHPHCMGARIDFVEDSEDVNILKVYGYCYKWGL